MKTKKPFYQKFTPHQFRQLLPLFFIIFIDSLGYFLVIPILLRLYIHGPDVILATNTSTITRDLLYGLTIALSPLAFLIIAPIAGHFSDRFGRKKTMFYCLLAALIGFLLPILGIIKSSVSLILIGRFIAGASSSSQPIAQAAIADITEGKRKAFYLSLIGFAMTLAMVLGPLAGGYLSDHHLVSWFNVKTPYWAGFFLATINIALLLVFYTDAGQVKAKFNKLSFRKRFSILKNALLQNNILLLLIVFLLMEIAWSQYYQSIFLYLTDQFHYSTDKIGLFTAYIGLWMSLGLTLIYRIWIKFMEIEKILLHSLIIATIGLIGCNFYHDVITQWIFIIPTAICIGTAYPSILAMLSNRTAEDHQGLVLGFASTVLALAWMLTGFSSGILISWFLPLPLMVVAGFMIGGLLIYGSQMLIQKDAIS